MTKNSITELCDTIRKLRQQHIFFKKKFRYNQIHEATGIPLGSLDYFIRQNKLPEYRYTALKNYVDKTIKEYDEWIK